MSGPKPEDDPNPFGKESDDKPPSASLELFEDEQEVIWWDAAIAAVNDDLDEAPCPLCGGTIKLLHRPKRMTFAGEEPACVQVECETGCGAGVMGGGRYG